MTNAVIVDVVRTGGGKRNGALSGWHAVDLLAETLKALAARNDLDPSMVDDVIAGCVSQVGDQACNVARSAVLAAGWPEHVPGTTVDRQCGSSMQSAAFAAHAVMAGVYDVVIACGVESMTNVPMGSNMPAGSVPFGPRMIARYEDRDSFGHRGVVGQGISAELIAQRWGISREAQDAYSVRSHELATAARDAGVFDKEIVPVAVKRRDKETGEITETGELHTADEGIRPGTTLETLAGLKPSFIPDGTITAGNASQIADGAGAALIMSEEKAAQLGLTPRARFHTLSVIGSDPIEMLTGPIPATTKVLERAKLTLDDIDHVEINEAFAPVVLSWQQDLQPNPDIVNPLGGAIALGHPLGASGVMRLATLLTGLEKNGGRYGLQTMCEGFGMANATIIERL